MNKIDLGCEVLETDKRYVLCGEQSSYITKTDEYIDFPVTIDGDNIAIIRVTLKDSIEENPYVDLHSSDKDNIAFVTVDITGFNKIDKHYRCLFINRQEFATLDDHTRLYFSILFERMPAEGSDINILASMITCSLYKVLI